MDEKICIVCGKTYRGRNKYFCSTTCAGLSKQGYKICAGCGKPFKDSPSNLNVCCSPDCSKKHRSSLHQQGVYEESIPKMRQGFRDKVDTIGPENFWTAKGWVICSPSGETYECRNLKNFIREHSELFDGTVKQAYDGFQKIKASEQGKRKRPTHSWKGWTLKSWSD